MDFQGYVKVKTKNNTHYPIYTLTAFVNLQRVASMPLLGEWEYEVVTSLAYACERWNLSSVVLLLRDYVLLSM